MSEILLEARNLRKFFPVHEGFLFRRDVGWIKAVDDVSFAIPSGQTLGLAGETGSGKTTTSNLILLLEELDSGSLLFRGRDVTKFSREELKEYRASVQAVFQDPFSSLSPRMKVHEIVAEPLIATGVLSKKDIGRRVADVLAQVNLDPACATFYPHQFSGGQRQRIAIARALSTYPKLIVLDEPVTALDVSTRAEIMNLFKSLQQLHGISYLLIAHDLATIRHLSDICAIMYLGKIIEISESEALFKNPQHPYTKALLQAALPTYPGSERKPPIMPPEEVASAFSAQG